MAKAHWNPDLSPKAALALALVLLAAVTGLDAVTGSRIDLSALYLLPILVAAWGLGLGWGAAFALLVGSLQFTVNLDPPVQGLAYQLWNAWNNLLVFLVAALAAGLLRRTRQREQQLSRRNGTLVLASQAYARQAERMNRLYAALLAVNRAATRSPSPETLLETVCRVMVETGEFAMAWVGWEDPATCQVWVTCQHGDQTGYLGQLQVRTDDTPWGRGPAGTAIREGRIQVNNDFLGSLGTVPWQAAGRQAGLASCAAIPLRREGARRGVLTVYALERDFFGAQEMGLLDEAGEAVGHALDRLEAEAGRRQAEDRIDGERRHLLTLINAMPDLVSLKAGDGRYLDCNPGYEELFGRPRAEILGRTAGELQEGDRDPIIGQLDAEVQRSRTGNRSQIWVTFRGDGRRRFLDVSKTPLLEADGSLYGILTVSRDITPLFESQTQLQEREAMLRRAQAIAKVGNWEFDPAQRSFNGSEEAYRILGLPMVEPIPERTFWDLVHPDDRERLEAAWASVAAGTPVESEYRIRVDGQEKWLHSQVELDTDALAGAVRILGTIQDITRTKRLALELERQEKIQAAIFARSPLAVNLLEVPGLRFLECNELTLATLGYSREELAAMSLGDLRAGLDGAGPAMAAVVEAGEGQFEDRFRRKDGTILDVLVSVRTIELEGCQRLVATWSDLTERKRIEAQVRLQALALDQSQDTVTVSDLDGRIMYANEAQCRLAGRTREELIGQSTEVYAGDPAGREAQYNLVRDTLVCGSWRGEIVQTSADGSGTPMDLRTSLVRDPQGRPIAMIAVGTDISERRLAEGELRQANRRLRAMIGCNLAVIHATDEQSLLNEVCRIIVQVGGHRLAWVGFAERDPERSVRPVAQSGADLDYLASLRVTWADTEQGRGPTGTAIRTGLPSYTQDARTDPRFAPWRGEGDRRGLVSALALPMWMGDRVFGALAIYSGEADAFDPQEIQLLTELVNSLAYGIQALRARADLRKLSLAVEQSPIMVVITDLNARIEYVNAAFTRITGYRPDEVLGLNPRILQSGQTPPATYEAMWAALREGRTWEGELVNRRKDGSVELEQALVMPLREPDGRISHYLALKEDVTEKRKTEDQLRKLVMAVEQSPESIVITDLEGTIEYVNPAFEQSSGYTRQEALGLNPRMLQSGQTPREVFQEIWDKLTRGEIWKGELTNRRKDGSEYVEFAIMAPIRQPDGRMTHYLAVKDDITEKKKIGRELDNYRRHLEELVASRTAELAAATARAQEANQAKSAFLANMSHEIRTPMNAILGLTHLLRREVGDPGQSQQLEKIGKAGQHLLEVINDILDFSKIEAGHLSLDPHDFAVARVVQDAWALVASKAEAKGLEMVTDIAALPATLHGDGLRLGQILLNLLANAVKFTERGRVALRGAVLDQDERTVRIRFEVQDTGIGLSPEQRDRLFHAFTQADASTTRRHGGTGLGLVISRSFAELMGGRMGVDSQPGQGSRFWVEAPFGRVTDLADPAAGDRSLEPGSGSPPESRPGATLEAEVRGRIAGRTVLLAEDNELNQEVALELLHAVGLHVDAALDGLQAVRMAEARDYDLVLMDIQMPELDGLQAARQIRALPAHRDTPILAMTANAFAEDLEAALAAGMADHVVKPVDPQNLFRKLDRWLATRPALTPAHPAAPAAPSGPAADPDPIGRLRTIPGLDLQRGLVAFRGDPAGLWRMLRRFAEQHRDDPRRLRDALAAQERDGATRLAHTLKGLAATFGLEAVHQAAAALETALRAGAGPLERSGPVAELERTMASACAAIGTGHPAAAPAEPAPELADLPERLAALRELLAGDDLQAGKAFERLLPALRARYGPRADALATEIRAFNFEQAVQALDSLLAEPGRSS